MTPFPLTGSLKMCVPHAAPDILVVFPLERSQPRNALYRLIHCFRRIIVCVYEAGTLATSTRWFV